MDLRQVGGAHRLVQQARPAHLVRHEQFRVGLQVQFLELVALGLHVVVHVLLVVNQVFVDFFVGGQL